MRTRKRAGIYCRISDDAALLGEGVERQEEDCRALADRAGHEVVELYVDNDISASTKSRKERPAYQRMLADTRAGRLDVIIGYSNSRLTRRPRELEDLIDLHAATGVVIETVVSGSDDLSTADGRMVARYKATADAAEAERTAERGARAQLQRAQQGRYNGPRPYGYDFATDDRGRVLMGRDKTLVINEPEAQVIREVVARVLEGEAIWSITKDLNLRGIATTRGGPWHTQTLRRMLMRWTHAGYRKHQKWDGKYVGKEQLYAATWQPIIDRDTHERVIAVLTDPTRRKSRSTEAKYLLTSIALCGACGGYLVGTTSYEYTIKGSYVRKDGTRSPDKVRVYPETYKCPHAGCHAVTRRMDAVDELVERVVVELLERDGVQALGGDPAVVVEAQARVEALQAKLALLTDQWTEDKITDEQLERGTARLRPQLESEQARLRAAQPADDSLRRFTGTGAGAAWKRADVVTKKRVLRALGAMVGLTITIDQVGAGASSRLDADRYAGIRIESVATG